jgi:predicted dehydrogenase
MKRYALAGASSRGFYMYAVPITEKFRDYAKLVGIFDINRKRAEYVSNYCGGVPVFEDFDRMIEETKPDCVIVTTIDRYHHEYAIRAMNAGCDVIVEKPMTIDEEKCKAMLETERKTGKRIIVTFNYRFNPYVTRIKELLKEGIIGEILSVDFEWILDTSHGADYFRRWHRRKENSGGLLVHKATHHFDVVNWWIEEDPEVVFANGTRRFYGPTREKRGERCLTCSYRDTCEFFVDYSKDPFMKAFYFDAEDIDGYYRDRCVFSPEIDIEDTMSVTVRYSRGAILTYSLIAYSPYEGWRIAINGTNGRIEAEEFHSGHYVREPNQYIKVFNRKNEIITYEIQKATGGHWGADERLQRMLFIGNLPDPLGHMAGSRSGTMSIIIGISANKSIASGNAIKIKDLLGDMV